MIERWVAKVGVAEACILGRTRARAAKEEMGWRSRLVVSIAPFGLKEEPGWSNLSRILIEMEDARVFLVFSVRFAKPKDIGGAQC